MIIAGYLPIYVLTGPSGRLFRPMADTMAFALLGSLLCSLTLLPVLCAYLPAQARARSRRCRSTSACRDGYGRLLGVMPAASRRDAGRSAWRSSRASLLLMPFIGAEFMPHLDEGALWVRATMPYTISFDEASKLGAAGPRHPARAFRRSPRWPTSWAGPTTAPIRSASSTTNIFVGLKPYDDPAWRGSIRTKPQLIDAIQQKLAGVSRHHLQLHAAGRRRRRRSGDRPEELAGGEDLRRRPRRRSKPRPKQVQRMHLERARHHATSRSCASSGSRA